MALTVTEASAVNQLLDFVYGRPRHGRPGALMRAEAHAAAQLLADHAYKTLTAGVRGADLDVHTLHVPDGQMDEP